MPGQDGRRPNARPRRLRVGDRVSVVAPAGPPAPDLLDKGVAILSAWGLDVRLGTYVHTRHPSFDYLAGTDAQRAEDLTRAWCDPDTVAVFCARGGYGAMRTLELLDWDRIAAAPAKVFTGSSDITALHQAIRSRLHLSTVFGAMVGSTSFVDDPDAQDNLRRMLFEPDAGLVLSSPQATSLVPGRARGIAVGGNLSLVASGVGVAEVARPPAGAVALLEDVTEEPYRLDRSLTHLRRAGWFDDVAGIALGSWVECGETNDVRAVLTDRLGDLGVPVVEELGFGHCRGQLAVPLGSEVELESDPRTGTARLTLTEPALA
ncbi:MAG: S66 peptidase family protein [Actinopolymorphaceae bacterium]